MEEFRAREEGSALAALWRMGKYFRMYSAHARHLPFSNSHATVNFQKENHHQNNRYVSMLKIINVIKIIDI